MGFIRVSSRKPCRLCRSKKWCYVTTDGSIGCKNISAGSKGTDKNGLYFHPSGNKDSRSSIRLLPNPAKKCLNVRHSWELNEVYGAFLEPLVLDKEHIKDLSRRGLGIVGRNLHGFKSMPGKPLLNAICRQLAGEYDLRHIPGFFYRDNQWQFVDYSGATGYLIPIKNWTQEIIGLQIRRDDGFVGKYMMMSSSDKPRGASSGSPQHFAALLNNSTRNSVESLIVTEGALKAIIIHEYRNDHPVTVGLVGTEGFNDSFPQLLKTAYPNLEKVVIAFDSDVAKNRHVAAARDRLVLTLEKLNLKSEPQWFPYSFKGYDDYLVHQSRQTRKLAA